MRIYFENYPYPDKDCIMPYFVDKETGKKVCLFNRTLKRWDGSLSTSVTYT